MSDNHKTSIITLSEPTDDSEAQLTENLDISAVSSLPAPDTKALLCLDIDNPLRAFCIRVYTHIYFSYTVLVFILLNSLLMLVTYAYSCPEHPCLQHIAFWFDACFTGAFTVEMLVKVIALGFIAHKQAYLRSGWNVLDFITVIASLISMSGAGSNVSVLRLLRVLRPLRTMSRVAGLRTLLAALFAAVPEIRDNVVLLIFLVLIFAILGVQVFGGALHRRCYVTSYGAPFLVDSVETQCGGSFSCADAGDALHPFLPEDVKCEIHTHLFRERPLSFENTGRALLLVFKVFTGDDWPEDMVALQNAVSWHAWVYFFLCIMVGGLFATNLFLAVLIKAYYTNAKRAEDDSEERQERAKQAWQRLLPFTSKGEVKPARSGSLASGMQTFMRSSTSTRLLSDATRKPSSGSALDSCASSPFLLSLAGVVASMASYSTHDAIDTPTNELPEPPHPNSPVDDLSPTVPLNQNPVNTTFPQNGGKGEVKDPNAGVLYLQTARKAHVEFGETNEVGPEKERRRLSHQSHLTRSSYRSFRRMSRKKSQSWDEEPQPPEEHELECCPGPRSVMSEVILHRYTERFVLGVVVLNVLVLAIDHYKINRDLANVLEIINIACTAIFVVELVWKVIALGPERCFRDRYNVFDAILVALSLPDLATGDSSAFTALRAFRMMRALRIVRRWPSVHNLLKALVGCVSQGIYIALLLLLQIFIFAILGMQLFEGKFDEGVRQNFNTLWEAALTCFVVITGDAWAAVMKHGMLATSDAAAIYFLVLFLIGNYVLVNVVVAVILDKLDDEVAGEDVEEAPDGMVELDNPEDPDPDDLCRVLGLNIETDSTGKDGRVSPSGSVSTHSTARSVSTAPPPPDDALKPRKSECLMLNMNNDPYQHSFDVNAPLMEMLLGRPVANLTGNSLGCFAPDNPLRLGLAKLVFSPLFDLVMLIIITVNVVFLALESPQNGEDTQHVLDVSNYIFTVIFFLEMILKIIVVGLWLPRPPYEPGTALPYLRDPWNRVDAVVVLLAVAGVFFRPLAAFRSLRTVRLVIRSNQMRLVIAAMVQTLPRITQGLVVCGFIWFVFGILGTQLFKGSFYYCNDTTIATEEECTGFFNSSIPSNDEPRYELIPREWTRFADHFDNVFSSMYTLFAVAVGEGWAGIMYNGIDARGPGKAPQEDHNPPASIFFVVFHVVGNFFCVNLIVGILINNFTEQRRMLTTVDQLSSRQSSFLDGERVVIPLALTDPPKRPVNALRGACFDVIHYAAFDRVVTSVIIINMLFLATVHYGQDDTWTLSQEIGNLICTIIFALEAVIKIVALGATYFRDNWNRFDFIVVVISLLGQFLPGVAGISAVRVLRVGRLFRLMHMAQGLQKLFNTMFEEHNLAYFGNVGMLCLALFFMFGVAGVSLFGRLERTNGLDNNLNFETVPRALLTLFAISTTEGWLDVRDGLTNTENCGGEGQGSCGSGTATLYILAFMIFGSFMMLNLFAAVVVEMFEAQEAQERREPEMKAVMELRERWRKLYDKQDTITMKEFCESIIRPDPRDPSLPPSLLPYRLRRVPRLKREEDDVEDESVECVYMSPYATPIQQLCYLSALGLHGYLPEEEKASINTCYVTLKDVLYVYLAAAFGLQTPDLNLIRELRLTQAPAAGPISVSAWFVAWKWGQKVRKARVSRHLVVPNKSPDEMTEEVESAT